jgi:hypothetical protein
LACASGAVAPLLVAVSVGSGMTWRPAAALTIGFIVLLVVAAAIFRVSIPGGAHAAFLVVPVLLACSALLVRPLSRRLPSTPQPQPVMSTVPG